MPIWVGGGNSPNRGCGNDGGGVGSMVRLMMQRQMRDIGAWTAVRELQGLRGRLDAKNVVCHDVTCGDIVCSLVKECLEVGHVATDAQVNFVGG